jgi:hypothetical protein
MNRRMDAGDRQSQSGEDPEKAADDRDQEDHAPTGHRTYSVYRVTTVGTAARPNSARGNGEIRATTS